MFGFCSKNRSNGARVWSLELTPDPRLRTPDSNTPGLCRPLSGDQGIYGRSWSERFCIFTKLKPRSAVLAYGIRLALYRCMDSLLYFKAASFSLITLCAVTGLVVLLISARRERDSGPPIRGAVMLTFLLAGLCAALALLFAYQIQKRTSEIFRLETVKNQPTLAARSS